MTAGENHERGYPLYVWHSQVHRIRPTARLSFWRFSFVPHYDKEKIFDSLRQVLYRNQIESFVVYETLGVFDLLLRLWVPSHLDPEDLGRDFEDSLRVLSLFEAEFMVVSAIDRHHIWQDGPEGKIAAAPLPADLELVSNTRVRQLAQYNDSVLAGSPHSPPPWLAELEASQLLRPLLVGTEGVRFFITYDKPIRGLRREQRDDVKRRIVSAYEGALKWAVDEYDDVEETPELSFYSGYGPMTDFLMLARAPDGHFYSFMRKLVFDLRACGIDQAYGFRPYTFVMAERGVSLFQEMPLGKEVEELDADVVDESESRALEFKSTLKTDFRRYLNTGEAEPNEAMTDAVVKTVCGFLNSETGGTLIIGLLELEPELERAGRRRDEILAKLTAEFGEPVGAGDQFVAGIGKALIGVEFEIGPDKPFRDWDVYLRFLEDLFRTRIKPLASPFVDVGSVKVADKTLAAIRVRPSQEDWFAATVGGAEANYVRGFASTRAYSHEEMALHQRANPRGQRVNGG